VSKRTFLATVAAALVLCGGAQASRLWNWRYDASGVTAAGTLLTEDAPDGGGFYRITGISGERNGVAITTLTAAGKPIPGNEPYEVDNQLRSSVPHLTKSGIGFALKDGTFANLFFADLGTGPRYQEFFASTKIAGGHTEQPVTLAIEPAGPQ
jgi:hypothetical protein